MADKDLEAKVQCLIEAFKHDRLVIIEVLKKNNFSLDAAAIELSEIPLPKPVQQVPPFQNYQIPPPIYNFHQPQLPPRVVPQPLQQQQPQPQIPQPQPPKVKNNKAKIEDEDVLYTEVTKVLGNTGLTESIIQDVHNQNGKNFDQTLRTIKTMAYHPTEEHKKMEELQIKYERENQLKEEMLKLQQEEEEMKRLLEKKKQLEKMRLQKVAEAMAVEKIVAEKAMQEKIMAERMAVEKEMYERKRKEEQEFARLKKEEEQFAKIKREREREREREQQEKFAQEKEIQERFAQEKEIQERFAQEMELQLKEKKAQEEKERLIKLSENKTKQLQEEIERKNQLIQEKELQKTIELKKQSEEQQRLFEQLLQEQESLKKLQVDQYQRAEELEQQKKKTEDLLVQQEKESSIKDLAHAKLIESQKHEILNCQQQIDILKQKEYQAKQENTNISVKSQIEIESLRQLLQEVQEKNKNNSLENEQLLKQQIQDLEDQKEFQRAQILELEQIKQKQIIDLESQLVDKQNELIQTKKSNFITLQIVLDLVQKEQINVEYYFEPKFEAGAIYWVGIYPTHQPKHERYHSYQKVTQSSGHISFPQIIPGHYEARLFRDKYTLLQTSNSVMIGPSVQLGVHVIGDKIDVTYQVADVDPQTYPYQRDWLGIYPQGARNKKYIESIYANSTGSVQFASPRVPGLYEIRYFTYPTKYNEQVKSSFELIDNDSVVISTPIAQPDDLFKVEYTINTYQPSTSDWVGIFSVTEENNKSYISSKYTNGTGHGQLEFNAPSKSGSYEIRFFSHVKGKYLTHKVSEVLIVTSVN